MTPLPPEKTDLKFCQPPRPMTEGSATCPVPFYPDAAHTFVTCEAAGRPDALDRAMRGWLPNPFGEGRCESERPYVALAARDDPEPLGDGFTAVARRVFEPLLAACTTQAGSE